jgi:hypothetical protein
MGGTICVCDRKPDQVGTSLLWLPWFITNNVISSINSAEDKLKRPPNVIEIFTELKRMSNVPIRNPF